MSTSIAKPRLFQFAFQAAVLSLASSAALLPLGAIAQPQKPPTPLAQPLEPTKPNSLENSVFSISGGERLMSESMTAISQQNYDLAATKLQDARQVFNQLSNFYQELTTSFAGIDNRISDSHRRRALQSAQLRDEATYQLAVVYRAKNQPELAVPLLIQLIRSQAPTRDLGNQAYQQLFELGFVDSQFVRPNAATPK
jgi:thioredoxin-like negative regulator of GroEL